MKKAILTLLLLLPLAAQAQDLSVFDIDTTNFPIMRAKFFAFDENGDQITNLSPSDFEITEDGEQRDVISVSCPEPKEPVAISSVLTIDVSGSMSGSNLNMAKEAGRAWINGLPLGKSECAITSFNSRNFMVQDFTTNRSRLLEKLSTLGAGGGTDFNAGFINPMSGALIAAENGRHKKVVVFLTDGYATGNEAAIIQKANEIGASIYCVTLNMSCPEILKNISESTGSKWFENVNNIENAKDIYLKILSISQSSNPCTIEWHSYFFCKYSKINVGAELLSHNISTQTSYIPPEMSMAKLEFEPAYIYFKNPVPGEKVWQVVKVTAENADFKINDIIINNQNYYVYPSNFTLKKGKSKDLQISYKAQDSAYSFCKMEFQTDICNANLYAGGSWSGVLPKKKTLKITHPNGGEKFIVGSDTIITWEGIAKTDTVKIELSTDNGTSWSVITDTATGWNYNWNYVPLPESEECLVRVSIQDNSLPSNSPEIEWQNCYGGRNQDVAYSIQQNKEDGYIVAGLSASNDGDIIGSKGLEDYWILQLDPTGHIQWKNNFGGSSSDVAQSIQPTRDKGYIVAGYSASDDGDLHGYHGGFGDYWILKLDNFGSIEWEKCLGGSALDHATSVVQTDDEGFVIAGYSNSIDGDVSRKYFLYNYWIVKLKSNGEIEWEKVLGGNDVDIANSIQQTNDGGFIIAGFTESHNGDVSEYFGYKDGWIVKLDSIGDIQWQKSIGGKWDDVANSIQQTFDGGYIVSGHTIASNEEMNGKRGYIDCWVIKLDESGEIQWQRCLGSTGDDRANNIVQTKDGGFLISGFVGRNDGDASGYHLNQDCWIVKLDQIGNIDWQKCLGGSEYETANSIQLTNDGGYIIAGYSMSNDGDVTGNHGGYGDYWIVKLIPEEEKGQSDTSDAVFSIVAPHAEARSIDMGREIVGEMKDSLFVDFVENTGSYKVRVDSIYFTGADANAFAQVSAFPVYEIEVDKAQSTEFRFIPNRVGLHTAKLNIITQAETLEYDITGIGEERKLQLACDILDFGEVELTQEKTITDTVLIKNISAQTIDITGVSQLGPDMEQFHIISGGEPFTLAPNGDHKMSLQFMPRYGGRTSGQLGFEYDGAGSPAIVQLFGTGKGGLVYAADDSAYAGDQFNLKLMLGNVKPEGIAKLATDYEATIRFQRTLLAPSGSIDWQSTVDSIYITINGKIGSTIELSEIPVIACLGNTEETSIDVVEMNLLDPSGNPIEYEFEKQSGTFTLLGICREGGARLINPDVEAGIINISPNPAEKSLNIEISLIEEGQTELSIFNSFGESVQTMFSANNETTGANKFKADISNLANGVYYVILKTPNQHFIEKVLVIR